MSKKILQSIVIILGIFIIIAFIAIIYGMYLKISIPTENSSNSSFVPLINLEDGEKIKNIEVIDENKLLILIENNNNINGKIYDIKKNKIIRVISE